MIERASRRAIPALFKPAGTPPSCCMLNIMSTLDELKKAGKKLAQAQARLDEAKEEAKKLANKAHWEEEIWEITITEHLGVDRGTVRRWLGKPLGKPKKRA